MNKHKYNFGDKVRCDLKGYEGTIYGKVEYATGCLQYSIQVNNLNKFNCNPDGSDGKIQWEDEGLLTFIEESKHKRVPKQVERYDFK